MTYNNIINREKASGLIPEDVSKGIIQNTIENSVVLKTARRLPNMSSKMLRMNVLSSLPYAYFVEGDTGLKQTTDMDWKNIYITAEEVAVIVPIPDNVADDAEYDLWGEVKSRISEAMGRVIDRAILLGENRPESWLEGIVPMAQSKGAVITKGTNTDIYDDILGEKGLESLIELNGYIPNNNIADLRLRSALRGLRGINGELLYATAPQDRTRYMLDSMGIEFPRNGTLEREDGIALIMGDFDQLVYSIRNDIRFEIFNQGVIQNSDGTIKYNLLQQDMKALRAVMRLGWQLPNPVNLVNKDEETRFPFAVLEYLIG